MGAETGERLFDYLIKLCDDLAWERETDPAELYKMTQGLEGAPALARLAEAFGLLLVRLEAREMQRDGLIAELKERAADLEEARRELAKRNVFLQRTVQETFKRPFIGQSPAIARVLKVALAMAQRPINVLLMGPTGTGKEVLAKMIFFRSPRSAGEFVAVNCAAIPATLFESEMFGIEKGVATGVTQRKGLIEESSGGTLFLDEVGDMTLENQAKLLRAIEEKEVTRVGGHKPIPVDLHVISATNQNILEATREKRFREDLYYRLNVLEIVLPPLSERGDDILLIARHQLRRHSLRLGRESLALSPEVDRLLMGYPWPGNARELNNEMERVASLAPGPIVSPADLSEKIRAVQPPRAPRPEGAAGAEDFAEGDETAAPPKPAARGVRGKPPRNGPEEILAAIARWNGNKTKAAVELGLSREGLRKRLKKIKAEP
ncbi:MAG: sigma-54 dependent transcriptional regulator [Deltaproteobacteria bacterium]|jgi:transcriptional regulator with PAS, ATPase and Fis domain|nr:sigma-54 dependent transcriptional regulator [Deltaproteobacteria bacterium]